MSLGPWARAGILLVATVAVVVCGRRPVNYRDQFGLSQFPMEPSDFYNPLTHTFKVSPSTRQEHPQYQAYDVYSDSRGRRRYAFFRSESYGYLMEFVYGPQERLEKIICRPILAESVDTRGTIVPILYFYADGRLRAVRDELNDELIALDEGSAVVYQGVVNATRSFAVRRIVPADYFPPLLH
jgi:hypothetical protein